VINLVAKLRIVKLKRRKKKKKERKKGSNAQRESRRVGVATITPTLPIGFRFREV